MPADALDIVDAEGEAVTLYLRQSDRLPLQQEYLRRDPKTRIPYEERSVFGRYKPVGGALLPWIIRRERDGDKIFELYADSYQVNVALSADLFTVPNDPADAAAESVRPAPPSGSASGSRVGGPSRTRR